MRRLAALLAMAAFGFGVYATLGALKSHASAPARRPTTTVARVDVTGTLFVVQGGSLYKLQGGLFTPLGAPPSGQWMQPVLSPDHRHLVVVDRQDQFSDLYMLDLNGKVVRQLTDNRGGRSALAHWAFYPRFSPDGQTVDYSYDAPKVAGNFRVDLAIWSVGAGATQKSARRASTPIDYTGGDTYPTPLAGGGLLYSKYNANASGTFSQLWYQARALSPGKALTPPDQDCGQPALSPDGTRVAMVCTGGKQTARLELAGFDAAGALGPPQVLVDGLVGGSPAFSPDGRTVVYFAPAGPGRHFQLWSVVVLAPSASPAPTPTPGRQLTTDLDFDATSAPAWMS